MEQRSTTHSPRVDDALAEATEPIMHGGPVESRTEEWRMAEPPADGEPELEAIEEFSAPPIAGALGEDERRRRSELAMALRPSAFPAERETLLAVAREEGANDRVLDLLEDLPAGTRFETVGQVWTALGGHDEIRETDLPAPTSAPSDNVDRDERIQPAPPSPPREQYEPPGTAAPSPQPSRPAPTRREPPFDDRSMLLRSVDVGIGVGVSIVHSALAVTRWTLRTAGRVFDRAA